MTFPKFRKILIVWALVNVLLGAYLIFSLFVQIEDIFPSLFTDIDSDFFFQFFCALSIFLFVTVFLLRYRIERTLLSLRTELREISSVVAQNHLIQCPTRKLDWVLRGMVVLFGIYVVFLSFTNVNAYSQLIWEDGVVEYASFVLWFLAAVLSLVSFLSGKRSKIKVYTYLALVLFFIVCGGEEISWGQHFFKFETPEILRSINKQDETTLHNIGSISIFSNGFFLLTLIFFLVLPFLRRKYRALHKYIQYHDLPVLKPSITHIYLISLIVWLVIGIRFGTLGFHPFSAWGYYGQLDDEIFELLAAYSFFAFTILDFTCRLKGSRQPLASSP